MRADTFIIERHYEGVAKTLQQNIPTLARDGLFEAKRGGAKAIWKYAFWIKIEKSLVEEVRISVQQKGAHSSIIGIEVFRLEGGLLGTKSTLLPVETKEWTLTIQEILKKEEA